MEKENMYESVLLEMSCELQALNQSTSDKWGYEDEFDATKKMHYRVVLGGVISAMVNKANGAAFDRQEVEDEIEELNEYLGEFGCGNPSLLPSAIFGGKYNALLDKKNRLIAERNSLQYEEDELMAKAYGLAYGDEFLENKIKNLRNPY